MAPLFLLLLLTTGSAATAAPATAPEPMAITGVNVIDTSNGISLAGQNVLI